MNRKTNPTRRAFLKGGALLAVPAVASVSVMAGDRVEDRLATLKDEAALRELHDRWLRRVNGGERDPRLDAAVRRLIPDHAGAPDRIAVAADLQTAVGRFDYAVELETELPRDSTLAQMAHAQGNGATRRTERRALTVAYTKRNGLWAIDSVAMDRA